MVPTPLCYFAAQTLDADGQAMITGSHNPPEYNGLKIGVGATTMHGTEIAALRDHIGREDFESGRGGAREQDIIQPYLAFVQGNLKFGAKRPKLVLDAGNGVGGMVAEPLFRALGCEVRGLFLQPDGNFPNHHPDPTVAANLEDLKRSVADTHADVGLAYDGDADRVGVVDEQGQIIWGDRLLILLAREVLKEVPGAMIIGEVKCSMTLFEDIEKHGGRALMWKAGHSLMKAKMREEGAELAGEMSGHVFFKNRYFGFDDGVYASARLVEILSREKRPLSALLADVPRTYATPEIRVDCPEDLKFKVVAAVRDGFHQAGLKTIDIDGVRVVFPDGWGLVRASNTGPLLVLRFEALSEARLEEIRGQIEGAVRTAQERLEA
jgi:phosphomannomutase/phosphoglucomutase